MLRKNTRVWKQCAHQEHHFLYIISRCIQLKHGRARGCMRTYIGFHIGVGKGIYYHLLYYRLS